MRIYEKFSQEIQDASTEEDLTRIQSKIEEKITRASHCIRELKESLGKLSSNKAHIVNAKRSEIAGHKERLKKFQVLRDILLSKQSELRSDLALVQEYEMVDGVLTRTEEGYELVMKA